MPYIKKGQRENLADGFPPCNPGELNYKITKTILRYLEHKVGNIPQQIEFEYTDYNEVVGVLELVKLELWDRLIRPYEKEKREENGDVF